MRHLTVGKQFRPATSHVYPPFKQGRYMEEYVYDYLIEHDCMTDYVYIPIFWTNLQNHPGFPSMKSKYNSLLQAALAKEPNAVYFTVVQHDDGPQLDLPPNTIIFGACTGSIPLPLIYEDRTERLLHESRITKDLLASFVGSVTHPIREDMCRAIQGHDSIVYQGKNGWSAHVPDALADQFIAMTLRSKFCLAPRGYGRSSFRFFEAMLLDTIPVYFWDDQCWLPYQDILDYSMFSVCISQTDIHRTYEILSTISDEQYEQMMNAMKLVRHMFSLEWMCGYIERRLIC